VGFCGKNRGSIERVAVYLAVYLKNNNLNVFKIAACSELFYCLSPIQVIGFKYQINFSK